MKTKVLYIICLMLVTINTFSQIYEPGKLWVSVINDDARAGQGEFTKNAELNVIFNTFNVNAYDQIMWFAKTPSLRDIYEINCDCDAADLKNTLENQTTGLFSFISQIPTPLSSYEPEDVFWHYNKRWVWHLLKIQADSAWEITIGNPQVKIGIIDHCVDIEHPDFATQIFPHFDPYSGYEFDALELFRFNSWHGTTVASFAGAKTAETGTYPTLNGALSSIGFNSKMVAYEKKGMERVLHASTVMDADVINCSWIHLAVPDSGLNSSFQKIITEVIGNGTVIVSTAGNGFCATMYNDTEGWKNCDSIPPDFRYFSAPYPFHPSYDSSIIIITSTDSLDNHTLYGDSVINRTHSHFPEIDICSPGHILMGATLTYYYDTISGDTLKKSWPYYGSFSGTSFAAPIVSGVCALLKSVNPCLTPPQIEEIIKLTADPVSDENQYSGLLGAGRINAYHAVKYAQDNYGYEEYVIGNGPEIIWTTEHQAKKITIEWGGKLTIRSTVYMLPGSDIIIEKGGELIIDGGNITTCKGLWNGIQVRGRIDLDQYINLNQGHLTLINGATIENAKIGAQTMKLDTSGADPYSTGGVIQAVNANFINCITGVSFMPYENFLNDKRNIKNNLSYLSYCNFKLDTNYYHVFNSPKQFIFMESVRGIPIKGCTFINEIKAVDYEDVTLINPDMMVGIQSMNSSFEIDYYCLSNSVPCDSICSTRFENLDYGIYATNYGSEKYPKIAHSEFICNKTGIYLGEINNSEINSNYFLVKSPFNGMYNHSGNIQTGVYLDFCTGYSFEGNYFESNYVNPMSNGINIGTVVKDSGPYPNEVYRNDFEHLKYGIIAMNENKRDSVGLCIKCNTFSYCANDISVVIDSTRSGWGIAEHQGSRDTIPTAPAGNIFTSNFTYHEFDLYNDDNADPFTYFHHHEYLLGPNVQPDFYSQSVSLSLNDQGYDNDESCPSLLGSGGSSSLEKGIMEETELQITSLEGALQSLVDGGNTQSLTVEVTTSTPPDALELKDQLITESPYLSDTVIKSAIAKEEVLNNAMLRDILVENPQSAKSDEIMQLIDERDFPMPDYMKDQIEQGKFKTGEKENLEARQSYFISERSRAFNNLIRIYQSESTVVNRLDSLVCIFDAMNTLENQYRKVFILFENGDTNQLYSLLNSIPTNFNLTSEQSEIHQKYEALLDIMINFGVGQGSVMGMDSTQIADLLDIYDDKTLPGIYARNILVTAGYLTYQEPYLFPDNLKQMESKPGAAEYKKSGKSFVFPNPAAYYTIIDFDIKQDESDQNLVPQVQINLYDLRGNLLKTLISNKKSDQLVLDVRDLKSGIYLLDLYNNGKRISTSKLIVNR